MKKIILPKSPIGAIIFIILLLLTFLVPLTFSYWLMALVAPWWVAAPFSLMVAVVTFLKLVKFPK